MAELDLRWEDEREREIVEELYRDWLLYGEIHMTNANGLTRLDPRGITYSQPFTKRTFMTTNAHDDEATIRSQWTRIPHFLKKRS